MVRLKSYHFGFCIYMACHQECVEMRLCDKARDCVCGWESGCQKSGCQPAIFRVIPNTAISVGESMTFVAADGATQEQTDVVMGIFNKMGEAMLVNEKLLEVGMILASCGIAFALRYIRAASEGGVELGCPAAQAARIVAATMKGAAELVLQNNSHPEQEIDKVTTAGGITIKGLNEMEHAGFSSAVIRGLKASFNK